MKTPIQFGKYYLLDRINVGGMAEVFKAKTLGVEGFERVLAVKRILPNIAEDREFISMFIDEAKIAVQLNHANIAQIFDLGKVYDSYYIALEYVAGKDLRAIFDHCQKGAGDGAEGLPLAYACYVVMKICEGLDYAHSKRDPTGRPLQLVHRDVSPQNVIVSFEGEVKLIDFGIVKAAGKASKTQAGILKGKFGYMSPEQVRGLPLDRRSDVFSVGVVLYELLTSVRLFEGESDLATLEKVRTVEVPAPSRQNPAIPEALERIVLKALARDVEDRHRSALELFDELQGFLRQGGLAVGRNEVGDWMRGHFADDIAAERQRDEEWRQAALPAVPELNASAERSGPGSTHISRPTVPLGPRSTTVGGRRATLPPGFSAAGLPSSGSPAAPTGERVGVDPEDARPRSLPPPPVAAGPSRPPPAPADGVPIGIHDGDASGGRRVASPGSAGRPERRTLPAAPRPLSLERSGGLVASTGGAAVAGQPGAAAEDEAPLPRGGTDPRFAAAPSAPSIAPVPIPRATPAPLSRPTPTPRPTAVAPSAPPAPLSFVDDEPPPRGAVPGWAVPAALGAAVIALLGVYVATRPAPAELRLEVQPEGGARVVVDGQLLSGEDGGRIARPAGRHLVAVERAGFKPWSETIELAPGEKAVRRVALEPLARAGFVIASPAGATVLLDGTPLGSPTPFKAEGIAPGRHRLEVRRGGEAWRQEVELVGGQLLEVKPTFTADQTAVAVAASAPPAPREKERDKDREPTRDTGRDKAAERPAAAEGAVEKEPPRSAPSAPSERAASGAAPAAARASSSSPSSSPPAGERSAAAAGAALPSEVEKLVAAAAEPAAAPAAASSAAPAAAPAAGFLRLNSRPWTNITIDGKDTGLRTPQTRLKLPAGEHAVSLANPEFGIDETFTVDIRAGETDTVIKNFRTEAAEE